MLLRVSVATVAVAGFILAAGAQALAAPPGDPVITEPVVAATPNPADVHMEAGGFTDPDGDTHQCTRWEIATNGPGSEVVWEAEPCSGIERVHIHLGDGTFTGSLAGQTELLPATDYELRVRFRDSADEESATATRVFTTSPAGPPGGAVPWTPRQPDYEVDTVATGFQLPTNIAFVPDPGSQPDDPLLYVTELYGSIKVVTRDGTVREYAHGLLNFNPTGDFPGSGEQGVTGIVVEPASGDVFASMLYEDSTTGEHYPKVVRFHSGDGGLTAASQQTILSMPGEPMGQSHQISNLTLGPDGKLYVHVGDGFDSGTAQKLISFRGKILRMNLSGTAPSDNPFYDGGPPFTARDYVYALGFRNPFGGTWRAADGAHYEVENGPSVDRFAKIVRGRNYLWDGSDASMSNYALYNWDPAHAPTNIAFAQPQTFCGSRFPAGKMDHAFVAESGPTYATGPQVRGKRIVEFSPNATGGFTGPTNLIEYTGTGRATAVGLAAGPDGLYFTDLYKDEGSDAIAGGANLLRVRYVGAESTPPCGGPGGAEPPEAATPETTITQGPKRKLKTRKQRAKARFRFTSSVPDSTFECRIDGKRFKACAAPRKLRAKAGKHGFKAHSFRVRARSEAGGDPTPARYKWKVKRKR